MSTFIWAALIEVNAMKEFRTYRCDFCNPWTIWTIFCNDNDPEKPTDTVCPRGHEAVTLQKCLLLDVVEVAIRPGAQIVDSVKGQIGCEYDFYLVVRDLHTNTERMSQHPMAWAEIKVLMDKFRNVSASKAWALMDKLDAKSSRCGRSAVDRRDAP